MSNNSIPPFYVGQEVVALKSHSEKLYKKGDKFKVNSIFIGPCCCRQYIITIGIFTDYHNVRCTICQEVFKKRTAESEFKACNFAPITSQFKSITFSEVMEIEMAVTGEN